MKKLSIVAAESGVLLTNAMNVPAVSPFAEVSQLDLSTGAQRLLVEVTTAKHLGTSSEAEQTTLQQKRLDYYRLRFEDAVRKFHLDSIAMLLLLLGIGGLIVSSARKRARREEYSRATAISKARIKTLPPKEEYITEYEMQNRVQTGYSSKEKAIEWLERDPLGVCDYCGEMMQAADGSAAQAVQLVTFYKAVPAGASDMRIVLDSLWFPVVAQKMVCSGCGRRLDR